MNLEVRRNNEYVERDEGWDDSDVVMAVFDDVPRDYEALVLRSRLRQRKLNFCHRTLNVSI